MKEMMSAFSRAGAQLTPEQSIFIVLQLLAGLDYAHRKMDGAGNPLRIVHCDVSPDNALVSWEGEVKLLDFGIARAATNLSNYKEGMLMGKLGYVAPEQASLETRWDHRVDLFAAGIILYELLTKQKPFPKATDVESLVQSRKAKVVPPTAIDPRLPKDVDAIVSKALAYDPEKRYSDARSFSDALVDVLFPTPHSAIQDLLGKQMKSVFAEKIARQRAARAHDPLIMKVLTNAAVASGAAMASEPAPISVVTPSFEPSASSSEVPTSDARRTPGSRPRTIVKDGFRLRTAFAFGLAVALAATAGLHYAQPWLRAGVVVVTSDPPGAEIAFDGQPTGFQTPAVLEDVRLSEPHEVTLSGERFRPLSLAVKPAPGRLVAHVHAPLASSVGELRVESDPPGADVRVDERPAGRTPATIGGVRLDARHRIDLSLPGHEIDQFVVLPEKDGVRFARRLVKLDGRRPGP
jgi:hypothetical protein